MTEPAAGPAPEGPIPISFRVRVLGTALAVAALVAAAFLTLVLVTMDARDRLDRATASLVEEERMADLITLHVMDQMVAAFALRSGAEAGRREEFQQAGRLTHGEIRQYLFRDLTPGERLQLETMAESHQRMEVAGLRAADLASRGQVAAAEASWTQMMDHAREFLEGMASFLDMRGQALEEVRAEQAAVFRVLLGAGVLLALLVLGAAVGLGWMVHRRVGRPLATLARASQRLGSGDLDARVPLWPDRELHQLARGFNRMAESLQDATRTLAERNRELGRTLDSLRQAQAELIQAEKLSALGRMSAGLAHELNNPLTSVIGYSRLLQDQLTTLDGGDSRELEEVRDELLAPIVTEANRAQQLVRNLLHFTRRAEVRLVGVELEPTLESILALRRPHFEAAGLRVHTESLPRTPVLAEPSLLQAAFLNIVNNARDAMRPRGQGTLTIRGEEDGDRVHLVFEDEGPGLPDPEQVFEPFFTTKPPGEGTGLGLSLVHRFMEQFGGEVRAENRDEGGARFVLTFRRAEDGAAAEEVSAAPDHPSEPPEPMSPAFAPSGSRAAVLVVEDEAPVRNLQGRLLEIMGLRPLLAESAGAAREILERDEVAAVLCDVRMPGESGLEFYRWLQEARPELAERLLFVTGDVGDAELLALQGQKPALFLHKPFAVEEYTARVRALLP